MYQCRDCGYRFEYTASVFERHGLDNPPYERIAVCPNCKSTDFSEITVDHCRCCGARLTGNQKEYCNDSCRRNGERMWERERVRRQYRKSNPLSVLIDEADAYNRAHGTCYTYGQYVAFIQPDILEGEKEDKNHGR